MIKKTLKNMIDLKRDKGDRSFRFSNFFDDSSRQFEDQHIGAVLYPEQRITDDTGTERDISWPSISFWQSYRYLEHQKAPFYLLQMSNHQTQKHLQVAVVVEVSKWPIFKSGTVQKWIMPISAKDESRELISELLSLCKQHTDLMELHIAPYMPGIRDLKLSYDLLLSLGLKPGKTRSYSKTRMLDLRPPVEQILNSFSANGRARLKIKDKDRPSAQVLMVDSDDKIPSLQKALNASYQRSARKNCEFDFSPYFYNGELKKNDVSILGFFVFAVSENPLAFITGIKHSNIVEFSTGGSLGDAQLRQFPFNHILLWQLANISKSQGAQFLDLGGITDGGAEDPLSGISQFKRLFPGFEMTVTKDLQITLRPIRLTLYGMLKTLMFKINKGSR